MRKLLTFNCAKIGCGSEKKLKNLRFYFFFLALHGFYIKPAAVRKRQFKKLSFFKLPFLSLCTAFLFVLRSPCTIFAFVKIGCGSEKKLKRLTLFISFLSPCTIFALSSTFIFLRIYIVCSKSGFIVMSRWGRLTARGFGMWFFFRGVRSGVCIVPILTLSTRGVRVGLRSRSISWSRRFR